MDKEAEQNHRQGLLGKKPVFWWLLLLLVLVFAGAVFLFPSLVERKKEQVAFEMAEVSLAEFKNLYNQKKAQDDFIILDLRPKKEWNEAFIPYSVWFDESDLSRYNNISRLDRYREIVVAAKTAEEARSFAKQLKDQEWRSAKKVYVLKTSISNWFSAGYPVEVFDLEL